MHCSCVASIENWFENVSYSIVDQDKTLIQREQWKGHVVFCAALLSKLITKHHLQQHTRANHNVVFQR